MTDTFFLKKKFKPSKLKYHCLLLNNLYRLFFFYDFFLTKFHFELLFGLRINKKLVSCSMNSKKDPKQVQQNLTPNSKKSKKLNSIKLTPITASTPRTSSIPDMLDSPEVNWENSRESSVSPNVPITPLLPKPNKVKINPLGLTQQQEFGAKAIVLLVISIILLMSSSSIDSMYVDSFVPRILTTLAVVLLLYIGFEFVKLIF